MSQGSGKAKCYPAFTCYRGLFPFRNWVPLSLPVSKPYNMLGVVYVLNYVTLRQTKDSFEYNISIPKDSG